MAIALVYLMMIAAAPPAVPRHCGVLCRLADQVPAKMPEISGTPPEHMEVAFADYAACLTGALEKSAISAQSSREEIDGALQAVDDGCVAVGAAATGAFSKIVVDSGSRNTPDEIARFADYVRAMIGAGMLMPVLAKKVGAAGSKEYAEMAKAAAASLMARK
ncbi:hypothetical protein U1839_01760 [Sphingomonas sp. RT2P30]|uniref:hypothetical protein n=1 Tax=Parasphingomonas halimpatiens TaxID=3096162 RepID=UPI002FC7430D